MTGSRAKTVGLVIHDIKKCSQVVNNVLSSEKPLITVGFLMFAPWSMVFWMWLCVCVCILWLMSLICQKRVYVACSYKSICDLFCNKANANENFLLNFIYIYLFLMKKKSNPDFKINLLKKVYISFKKCFKFFITLLLHILFLLQQTAATILALLLKSFKCIIC